MTMHTRTPGPLAGSLATILDLAAAPLAPAQQRRLRAVVEAHIEAFLAVLDHLDGDTDLEPSLAAHGATYCAEYVDQARWAEGASDERESDESDLELGGDEEASLGSLDRAINQERWGEARSWNADLDYEAEPYARPAKKVPFRAYELLWREADESRRLADHLEAVVARVKGATVAQEVRR